METRMLLKLIVLAIILAFIGAWIWWYKRYRKDRADEDVADILYISAYVFLFVLFTFGLAVIFA